MIPRGLNSAEIVPFDTFGLGNFWLDSAAFVVKYKYYKWRVFS